MNPERGDAVRLEKEDDLPRRVCAEPLEMGNAESPERGDS